MSSFVLTRDILSDAMRMNEWISIDLDRISLAELESYEWFIDQAEKHINIR